MKVSVIIPVYNTSEYLEECLQSILNNNFQDMEILCINDSSTDNSLQILQTFQKEDSRIKIIENPKNMGLSYTKQHGLSIACGKYIMYLDSDDYVNPHFVSEAYNAISKDNLDVVFFKLQIFPKGTRGEVNYNDIAVPALKTTNKEKAVLHLYSYDQTKITRRQFLLDNKLKYLQVKAFEDIHFNTCLLACTDKVFFIPKTLYYYRIRGSSITNSVSIQTVLDLIRVFATLKEYLEDKSLWSDYKGIVLLNKYKKIYSYYLQALMVNKNEADKVNKYLRENATFEELLSIKLVLKGKIFFFMKRILQPSFVDFLSINYLRYGYHNLVLKVRRYKKNSI